MSEKMKSAAFRLCQSELVLGRLRPGEGVGKGIRGNRKGDERRRGEWERRPGHVCRASPTTTRMCCGHSSILQARYSAVAMTR